MASTPNLHNPRGPRRLSHISEYDRLPQPLGAIMKALSDTREMAYSALSQALLAQGFSQASLDEGLRALLEQGYLETFFDAELFYTPRVGPDGKFRPRAEEGQWDSFHYGLDSLDSLEAAEDEDEGPS
jgi:DNA-binding transcriptional ArsR family regulator